ncbi:hypothetical protein EC526_03110 [Helicobacter pylori]|nr:hypothetical protein EC526_03110 [Helicobacter pylori]
MFRWKIKPLLASKNVLCVLRTHAGSLCVKNGNFLLETDPNQKKKKDFHGINKILRIFMIEFRTLLSFFCFYYLIGVRYWCDFT